MLTRILEAILFAADGPVTAEQISAAVPEATTSEIVEAIQILRSRYEHEERGWKLDPIAGGWQLLSHPDLYTYVERFLEGKRRARLSRAGLETLAVIAYRQPVTRGELEDLRGVDSGGVLHTLMERDLITIAGRSKAIGRPLYYATTDRFLEYFGIASLNDLPRLEEIEALWASDEVREQLEAEMVGKFPDAPDETPGAVDIGGNGADAHIGGNGNRGNGANGDGDAGDIDGNDGNGGNGRNRTNVEADSLTIVGAAPEDPVSIPAIGG